jgi:hypothetical protein
MELKSQFYECITSFYMGKQSEDQQKWGECLAYYTVAFNKLNDCIKLGKVHLLHTNTVKYFLYLFCFETWAIA